MTLAEYTDEIAFQLGGSVLDLEIANDLPRCVNRAFREIKRYITTPAYMTLPWNSNNGGNRISLKDKNVYSIINVMRPNSYNSLTVNSLDVFGLAQSYSAVTNLNAYMNRMLRLQQMNTISTDLDFVWDAHTKELYVTMNPPYTNQITIAYVPDYQSVEEITEVYWVDFILKLATAYAKQVLGRIRSKYTLNSAQYGLDGDTLLAEAKEEINEIISYLRENADIAFPID
jgi:hypothetical protein